MFKKKSNDDKKKNQKLTSDSIRIRINRMVNNSPVEIAVFMAELKKDKYNNTVMLSEADNFKEEFPGIVDGLISDVLYKLESRSKSLEEQKKIVTANIEKQQAIIKDQSNGYYKDAKGEEVKINIQTEKSKLRLLKCVLYTLENKKGEGFYESIELDGVRTLTYLIIDGELIPYWFKTPLSHGEPVLLVPDISLRKKFYKEATEEAIQDFNDSQDTMWRGILGVITKGLYVTLALGLIIWTIYLARWSGDLKNESLQPQLDSLNLQISQAKQDCAEQLANQVANNGVLIEWAGLEIQDKINLAKQKMENTANNRTNAKI